MALWLTARFDPVVVHWLIECFFFQAEDGIRDLIVTGVQTCALPISILLNVLVLIMLASGTTSIMAAALRAIATRVKR